MRSVASDLLQVLQNGFPALMTVAFHSIILWEEWHLKNIFAASIRYRSIGRFLSA